MEKEALRRAKQSDLLYRVGQRVSSELDLRTLFSEIIEVIHESFDYHGVMFLLKGKNDEYRMQAIEGVYKNKFPVDLAFTKEKGMIGQAISTGKTQHSGNTDENQYYFSVIEIVSKSELSIPVTIGKRVLGILDIQSDKYNAFSKTDISVLETLSTDLNDGLIDARAATPKFQFCLSFISEYSGEITSGAKKKRPAKSIIKAFSVQAKSKNP